MFKTKTTATTPPPPPAVKPASMTTMSPPPPPPPPPQANKTWPEKGSYVYAKILDWQDYYGGQVVKVKNADSFEILFDDGERHKNVKRSEMVKSLEQLGHVRDANVAPVLNHRFKKGDRVSCKISGWSTYYDGVVTSLHAQGYSVEFDDGDKVSVVREKEMIPIKGEAAAAAAAAAVSAVATPVVDNPGSVTRARLPDFVKVDFRIEAKCPGWHKYYAGVVKSIDENGETCTVQFDDGEVRSDISATMVNHPKTKSTHQLKFVEEDDEEEAGKHKYALQTRVMANPHGTWSKAFPGQITNLVNDGTYGILFDDGERVAGVEEQDISLENQSAKLHQGPSMEVNDEAISYVLGQNVEAKVGLWRKYYPGTINKINADGTYVVEFVDGEVVHHVKHSEMRAQRQRATSNAVATSEVETNYVEGERVAAKIKGWKQFWGGYVIQVNKEEKTFKIEFDDGEMYYVFPEDMIKLSKDNPLFTPVLKPTAQVAKPAVQATPAAAAVEAGEQQQQQQHEFDIGERVECKVEGWDKFYPGLVEKHHADGTYAVQFDDIQRAVRVNRSEIRRMVTTRNHRFSVDDDE